mmetsp:Transcript_28506/g.73431  ORF Transcript_28506/g.73431 Transcript_28506/m.73431 type:complete len:361 (+) Transcript_28506:225-1307(+)
MLQQQLEQQQQQQQQQDVPEISTAAVVPEDSTQGLPEGRRARRGKEGGAAGAAEGQSKASDGTHGRKRARGGASAGWEEEATQGYIESEVHSLAPSPRSIEEQQQEGQEQHLLAQGNVAPSAGGRKAQKGKGKGGRSAAQRWESRGRATPTRTATQVQRGGAHRSGGLEGLLAASPPLLAGSVGGPKEHSPFAHAAEQEEGGVQRLLLPPPQQQQQGGNAVSSPSSTPGTPFSTLCHALSTPAAAADADADCMSPSPYASASPAILLCGSSPKASLNCPRGKGGGGGSQHSHKSTGGQSQHNPCLQTPPYFHTPTSPKALQQQQQQQQEPETPATLTTVPMAVAAASLCSPSCCSDRCWQ